MTSPTPGPGFPVARWVAALVLAAVGCLVPLGTASPAAAAGACGSADGITVVVDPKGLGGGVRQFCVAPGGHADDLFQRAGVALRYAQRHPGMVCRVDERPADAGCVQAPPADAYWSLWWSDGSSGSWVYSNLGVTSLSVPDGGSVAFAWSTGSRSAPAAPAYVHDSAPSTPPSAQPGDSAGSSQGSGGSGSAGGSKGGRGAESGDGAGPTGGVDGSGAGAGAPTAAAPPTSRPSGAAETSAPGSAATSGRSATPTPRGSPTGSAPGAVPSESPSGSVADAQVQPAAGVAEDGGLPTWVVLALVLVLFLAAGASVLLRRRMHPGS